MRHKEASRKKIFIYSRRSACPGWVPLPAWRRCKAGDEVSVARATLVLVAFGSPLAGQ